MEQSNLARVRRAQETRRAYGAEARAARLAKMHDRMERILDRMAEPHVKYHFGGKDNTLNEVGLEDPDSEMLRQYASALASLSRAEMEIVKYEERGGDDGADVDRWLGHVLGSS